MGLVRYPLGLVTMRRWKKGVGERRRQMYCSELDAGIEAAPRRGHVAEHEVLDAVLRNHTADYPPCVLWEARMPVGAEYL